MLKAGDILDGRYEVINVLGQGGMGIVYLCRNNRLGKLWAIKEISKRNDSSLDFPSEARLLKDLDHPGIPRVIDIFYENNNMYMVEDYIKGQTLESLINKKGPLKNGEVYETALKLCDILEYLHSFDPPIIYRDLKPSNIMMTPECKIYLIDFGISRTYKEYKTGDTVYMGSKGYAAPEQYGSAQSSKQTDVFGLGSVMYFMAKGTDPSSPIGPSCDDTYDKWTDEKMKNIIRKATQLESDKRYLSIGELKEAISHALDAKSHMDVADKTRVMQADDRTMLMKENIPECNGGPPKRRILSAPGFIPENIRHKKTILKLASLTLAFFAIIFAFEHFVLANVNRVPAARHTENTSQQIAKSAAAQSNASPDSGSAVQSPIQDTLLEGYIDMNQPIILDSGNTGVTGNGKSKGKYSAENNSLGTFYEVNPQAEASKFNNRLDVSIEYIETEGNATTAYCSINNTLGEGIGISLENTYLSPDGSGSIFADASESVVPDSIESGTGKQYVKLVFNGFYMNSGKFTINTSTVSRDPVFNNQNINLTVNVR